MGESQSVEVGVEQQPPASPASRRHRTVTGVVAAMLVAGSGGLGFGLGRSLAEGEEAPAAAPATTAPATIPPADTVPEASAPPLTSATPTMDAPATTAPSVGVVTATVVDGPTPGMAAFDLVWEGTTESGYRLRLQTGPSLGDEYFGGFGDWRPEPFCWASEQMRLTLDGPGVVDVGVGSWFTELYGEAETVFAGDLGVADGRPVRAVVVQVTDAIAAVTATWADGVEASAAVTDGVAVLVVDGSGAWQHPFDLELERADGTTTSVSGGFAAHDGDPEWRAACTPPPPALPNAGEQPADPEAARAEIEARFLLLRDQSVDPADKPVLLDDDTGVDEATAQLREGAYAQTARTAVFRIDELVFTAPDRAWFRYSIDTDITFFGDRYGVTKLTEDGWIFPRALVCQDLALASVNCDPPYEDIRPSSAYGQYDGCLPDDCPAFEDSAIAGW